MNNDEMTAAGNRSDGIVLGRLQVCVGNGQWEGRARAPAPQPRAYPTLARGLFPAEMRGWHVRANVGTRQCSDTVSCDRGHFATGWSSVCWPRFQAVLLLTCSFSRG